MKLINIKKTITHLALTAMALLAGVSSAKGQDNSLLYKIEGKGIQPSYVYGTIHIMPQKDFNLKDKVKKAFDESEVIALEMDMDDPGLQMKIMQNSMMEGDTTIDQLMDTVHYAQLDAALKEALGMGIAPFNKMKPFVVSSMLMMKVAGEQAASFETTFVQMAMAAEKEILGLETVQEQLGVFDKISYQDQADDIVEMLDDPESMEETYADMVAIYKTEDITALYAMMDDYFSGDEKAINLLLHERNLNWMPKIRSLALRKPTFFGVGAGHLGGELGVINLLKKEGYKVTPITEL